MAKIDPEFSHDLYRFLPKPVRDADQAQGGLVERYLQGPQGVWEDTQDKILSLKTLFDVDKIDDQWLIYLKWTVGWTSEEPYNSITESLTPAELRKLIKTSVQLWKLKGTELGLRDAIRVITGRDVVIRNWFSRRWILGVARLWRLGDERDPFLVGQAHGERDEYLTVILVNNEVGIQRDLIRQIANLNRPLQEAFDIAYPDLVDDFRLGRQKWITDTMPDVVWDSENFRLVVSAGTIARANVPVLDAAGPVVWRHRVAFTTASGGVFRMEFRRQTGGAHNRYRATWNQDGTGKLEKIIGGVTTSVATFDLGHILPQDETSYVGIDVAPDPFTPGVRVRVIVYDNEVIDHLFTGADIVGPGQWRVENAGADDVRIDDVVAFKLPLVVDRVSGSGIEIG